MSEHKPDGAASMKTDKDELLSAYQSAAKDDIFTPAPRVRSAVLMYARTLADHRNAFPGSVAHRNDDEALELSSVPREGRTLDPRPMPHIKPLPGDAGDQDSWPRETPGIRVVRPRSPWLSLGQWIAAAAAGGLALGASYSWFNASRHNNASPEPVLAQAPAAPPVVASVASETQAKPPESSSAASKASADKSEKPREVVIAQADQPAKTSKQNRAATPRAKTLPAGSTVNPPVSVADGSAIATPQIAARPLSSTEMAGVASRVASVANEQAVAAAPAAAPAAMTAPTAAAAPQPQAKINREALAQARAEREAYPERWMIYVNDLRSRGHVREADAELARLRERHHQFVVPATKPANAASAP